MDGRVPLLSRGCLDLPLWCDEVVALPVCSRVPPTLHDPCIYNWKKTRLNFILPRKTVLNKCLGYGKALHPTLELSGLSSNDGVDIALVEGSRIFFLRVLNKMLSLFAQLDSLFPGTKTGTRKFELRIQEKIEGGGHPLSI